MSAAPAVSNAAFSKSATPRLRQRARATTEASWLSFWVASNNQTGDRSISRGPTAVPIRLKGTARRLPWLLAELPPDAKRSCAGEARGRISRRLIQLVLDDPR